MERNWELIRKILLKLAEKADDSPMESDVFAKFSAEITAYHYKILAQVGLIEVEEYAPFRRGLCRHTAHLARTRIARPNPQ